MAVVGSRSARRTVQPEARQETVVPITEAGTPLTTTTSSGSRPPDDDPIMTLDAIGRADVRARVASDGTRWCRCCDTTAPAGRKSTYCPAHLAERNGVTKRLRARERRAEAERDAATDQAIRHRQPQIPPDKVLVDVEALQLIRARTAQMMLAVGRASEHYNRIKDSEGEAPVWLDNLMWSAKHLDSALTSQLLTTAALRQDAPARNLPAPQPRRRT